MVVVTDGESHDVASRESVLDECDKKGITRFGIAVSDEPQPPHRPLEEDSGFPLTGRPVFPGPGLLHKKQHRHGKPDRGNQIHRQQANGKLLLQCVRGGGPLQHRWDLGRSHLQHRRLETFPM